MYGKKVIENIYFLLFIPVQNIQVKYIYRVEAAKSFLILVYHEILYFRKKQQQGQLSNINEMQEPYY